MAIFVPDSHTLLGVVNDILIKESIAFRVSDIQPMIGGSLGVILGTQRDHTNDTLTVYKTEVKSTLTKARSVITQEVIQDLHSLYGEEVYTHIANYMVDDLIYQIDDRFLAMLRDRAKVLTPLVFPSQDYKNRLYAIAETIMLSVNKSLSDFALSDNRSPKGFAIVSSDIASILSVATTMGEYSYESSVDDPSPSFIGTFGGVDYYVDYTHNNSVGENIILGTKTAIRTKGSAVVAPQDRTWEETVDAQSGENVYFIFDRTAMGINPVDELYYQNGAGESQYVGKIDVDLDDVMSYLLFS